MHAIMNDIAHVIAGYSFRIAIDDNEQGTTRVLQAKDIIMGELLNNLDGVARVTLSGVGQSQHLEPNDILIVTRGMERGSFRSVVFKAKQENVIPSSSLHIIRIKNSDEVLPDYLSYYLNSTAGQQRLIEITAGAHIRSLSRKSLAALPVPIPPVDKQQTIVDLQRNMQEQQRILDRRNKLKQDIIKETFKSITKI